MFQIDASKLNYRQLNEKVKSRGPQAEIEILNLCGQRYLASGLNEGIRIQATGVAGNNLAAFADGVEIDIHGSVQDGVGNTLNGGHIKIYGSTADIPGYSMRGGQLWIKGSVGYRCGIHMKSFRERVPKILIGGTSGDFLGEYMAGGIIVVLGLTDNGLPTGRYTGTGMHGGEIYIPTPVPDHLLADEIRKENISGQKLLSQIKELRKFLSTFGLDPGKVSDRTYLRLTPRDSRPYGKMYAY